MGNNTACTRVYADIKQIQSCKTKVANLSVPLSQLSKILSLAGNQVRLTILYLLQDQAKLCVCDLSDILEMKIPAVSQHLRKLKDGGLVEADKIGQTVFYTLKAEYKPVLAPYFLFLKKPELLDV